MSELSGSFEDPVAGAGEGEPIVQRSGLQCALKPRARGDSLHQLKYILDSVPFTPSQGVRTPSPRFDSQVRFSSLK